MSQHGEPQTLLTVETLLGDDPDLWLVLANLSVWAAAHPCDCESLCTCDEERA